MLRYIRIALFVLLPALTLATVVSGCGDDTNGGNDMSIPKTDMAAHDMASHD